MAPACICRTGIGIAAGGDRISESGHLSAAKPSGQRPRVGPWVSVNVSTRGTETKQVKAHPGEGFGVLLNLPPEDGFASYAVDLYNPAGKLEWSGPISVAPADEARQIYIPGRDRRPGTYTLAVRGTTPAGESKELSRESIDLQIQ